MRIIHLTAFLLVAPRASADEDAGKAPEPTKDAAEMRGHVVEEQKKVTDEEKQRIAEFKKKEAQEAKRKEADKKKADLVEKLRAIKVRLLKKPFVRFVAVFTNLRSLPSGKDGDDVGSIEGGQRVEVVAEKVGYFGIRHVDDQPDVKKETRDRGKTFDENDIAGWVKKKYVVSPTAYKRIVRKRELAKAREEAHAARVEARKQALEERAQARAAREDARKARLERMAWGDEKKRRSQFLTLNGVPGGCANIRSTEVTVKDGVAWSQIDPTSFTPRSHDELTEVQKRLVTLGTHALYDGFCEHGATRSVVFGYDSAVKLVFVRCRLTAGWPPGACAIMQQGMGEAGMDND